ncbi:hypothetical protein XENTR_v10016650 [Xenopus tropicalis]|nr:hypothetical protein XENTR_v10016650 [Xenopus tropicalis]
MSGPWKRFRFIVCSSRTRGSRETRRYRSLCSDPGFLPVSAKGSLPRKVKMWQSVGLTFLVFVATLICVLLFMLCGWYVVWHLFLSKFKFLRELVCDSGSLQGESESSETPSDSDAPPSPEKQKPKSTRQRRIPAEEAT